MGGLPGVRAMAFPHKDGLIEVACNVEMFEYDSSCHSSHLTSGTIERSYGQQFYTTRLDHIRHDLS